MTPEKVTELAQQAGVYIGNGVISSSPFALQRFAQLVRNAALEEAAKHCQACSSPPPGETQTDGQFAALHLAQQIRSFKS